MLFYSPEDPIEIPQDWERALHRSQWLPSAVIAGGSVLILTGAWSLLGPPAGWLWGVGFGLALACSLAVPMWCGIRYDRSLPSQTLGGLRALGIWLGFQGLLLALSVVFWGLMIDLAGHWPDRKLPTGPGGGPLPITIPSPLSEHPSRVGGSVGVAEVHGGSHARRA